MVPFTFFGGRELGFEAFFQSMLKEKVQFALNDIIFEHNVNDHFCALVMF